MNGNKQISYTAHNKVNNWDPEAKYSRLRSLLKPANEALIKQFNIDDTMLNSITAFRVAHGVCGVIIWMYQRMCTHTPKVHIDVQKLIVTDAFAGAGGFSIILCKYFDSVNAIEANPNTFKMLSNNLALFSKTANTFNDYYQTVMYTLYQDIIIFDPPWPHGSDYSRQDKITEIYINNKNGESNLLEDLIIQIAPYVKYYIIVKLPRNYDEDVFENRISKIGQVVYTALYSRPYSSMFKYINVYY